MLDILSNKIAVLGTSNAISGGNPDLAPYDPGTNTTASTRSGFIIGGTYTIDKLWDTSISLGVGTFGFFDQNWNSVTTPPTTCCPLYFVAASPYPKDDFLPFTKGMRKPIISPSIDPRRVNKFYVQEPCSPQRGVLHVGAVPANNYSAGAVTNAIADLEVVDVSCTGTATIPTSMTPVAGLTIVSSANPSASLGVIAIQIQSVGSGQYALAITNNQTSTNFTVGDTISGTVSVGADICTITFQVTQVYSSQNACCKDFVCGKYYQFVVQITGSPIFRKYFKSDVFYNVTVDGGCCTSTTAIYVDPGYIYKQLVEKIATYPELHGFVYPILYYNGQWYYPPQSLYPEIPLPKFAVTWDTITFQPNSTTTFCGTPYGNAGFILVDIHSEVIFDKGSFLETDYWRWEPVIMNVQQVKTYQPWYAAASCQCPVEKDCTFNGVCTFYECPGHIGHGHSEDVLRSILDSETIRLYGIRGMNFTIDDVRMRELRQINSGIYANITSGTGLYYKYVLDFNHAQYYHSNPTPPQPNPRYKIEIYTTGRISAFETFVKTWLSNCNACADIEVYKCNQCDLEPAYLPSTWNSFIDSLPPVTSF